MLADTGELLRKHPKLTYLEHRGAPPGMLFQVLLELTHRCNLKCGYCHVEQRAADMDKDQALRIIGEAAALGVKRVALTGGEPTLYPHLKSLMAAIHDKGMEVGLVTNGYLVTTELAGELKGLGTTAAGVTLMRADEAAYDKLTGVRGSFKAATNALAALKAAGIPQVVMLTIGAAHDVPPREIHRLIELAAKLGVGVNDRRMIPIGRPAALRKQAAREIPGYQGYCRDLHEKRLGMVGKVEVGSDDPLWYLNDPKGPFSFRDRASAPDRAVPFCPAGWYMVVTPELDVKPCAYLNLSAGSLKTQSLEQVWHDSPLLKALRCRDNVGGKCGTCTNRRLCGGCRATAYAVSGDPFAEDPYCWVKA